MQKASQSVAVGYKVQEVIGMEVGYHYVGDILYRNHPLQIAEDTGAAINKKLHSSFFNEISRAGASGPGIGSAAAEYGKFQWDSFLVALTLRQA